MFFPIIPTKVKQLDVPWVVGGLFLKTKLILQDHEAVRSTSTLNSDFKPSISLMAVPECTAIF